MMRHNGALFDGTLASRHVAGARHALGGDTDDCAPAHQRLAGAATNRIDRLALRQRLLAPHPGTTGADHAMPPRRKAQRYERRLRDRIALALLPARSEQQRHIDPHVPHLHGISRGAPPAP
jgi:hypothetical protein